MTDPAAPAPAPEPKPPKPIAMVAGLAALAALLVGATIFFDNPGGVGRGHQTLPGKPAVVGLRGFVQVRDPAPRITHSLPQDGVLTAGEFLILRGRISSPAFLFLLAQKTGGASEPLWPANDELHPAGEFELDEGDYPLALDPQVFGAGSELILLACPAPLTSTQQRSRVALTSAEAVQQQFPSCTGALLHAAFKESK